MGWRKVCLPFFSNRCAIIATPPGMVIRLPDILLTNSMVNNTGTEIAILSELHLRRLRMAMSVAQILVGNPHHSAPFLERPPVQGKVPAATDRLVVAASN